MKVPNKPKVTVTPAPDGPYLVKGLGQLQNRKGRVETQTTIALCRCGGSANKPFCDGTHAKIGFSSAKLDGRAEDRQDNYEAAEITIHDNRGICAHAGVCTDGLPAVFRLKQEPWIDAGAAPAEEIETIVRSCPSGALSHTKANREHLDQPGDPSIFIAPNGPYVVRGGPELQDTQFGEGASREHYTLCRCGGSKNKPFCDGTHWHNGFKDDQN